MDLDRKIKLMEKKGYLSGANYRYIKKEHGAIRELEDKLAIMDAEKRISELDRLFTRLYEDNVSGKISDERFEIMSKNYDEEQKKLKQGVSELAVFIEAKEQKSSDISQFIEIIRKYSEIIELTPEIMHELIEKIVVHAPDKSSGHRVQQIDIYYRFNIAVASAVADSMIYDKKRKAA